LDAKLDVKHKILKPTVFLLVAGVFLFLGTTSVSAATRYVNADSSGAATNPTRPFDDPSYTANDSYATFGAAFTAATTGDTIELSGGVSGKSYLGHTSSVNKANLIIQGSQIANHNGTVTFAYNSGGGTSTISLNANGLTLQRVTVTRLGSTATEYALRILLDSIIVRDVTIMNTNGFGIYIDAGSDGTVLENIRVDTSTIAGTSAMLPFNAFTMRNSIFYGVDMGGISAISFQTNSGTSTLDNVVFDGISSGSIAVTSGSTVNLTNCVMTAGGFNTQRVIHFNSAGTVNTTNCFLQGPMKTPHTVVSGTGTWNSTNDIIGEYSYFTRTKENTGYIMLQIDDRHNLSHFKTLADYAFDTYGFKMSFYTHDTMNLTSQDKTDMQELYLDGHEIAIHTRHHTNMGVTGPLNVTYTGAAVNIALVVSSSGTSLSATGSANTFGPLDLTSAAYDTVGELCTHIESLANYTCALTGTGPAPTKSEMPSITLKDASTSLPISSATVIPYDDNTGPTNRYMTEEVTNAIADVEAAMDENGATAAYVAQTFGYPYSLRTDFTSTWIAANTNLISIRNVSSDSIQDKSWLGNININKVGNTYEATSLEGTGYDALSDPDKQLRIEQSARSMVTFASLGMITGYTGHNPSQDLSVQEWLWLIDEIAVYSQAANIEVATHADIAEVITTSGNWADQGTGFWTRTFSGSADYRLRSESAMINAGITASGRTDDILDNPLVGTPDIGAYEFQAAATPTSLAQYKSNGVTTITSAAWTNETTVVLKFSMSSANSSDLLTPEVEVRTNATAFTNVVTHTGTPVAYSGSPVTGTVTVTGLSSGSQYHWQARATNEAGSSSWQTMGGSPDFGIDTTAPTTPGTPSTTTPTTDTTPSWTWTASTDASSGLANPAYTIQWSQAADFLSGVTTDTVNTNAFTHSTPLAQGTWYFRVKATDAQGNESPYSSNGSVLIDTSAPTAPGTPSTTTPTTDTTPSWTWTASTDSGVGLANPAYTVQWSQAADFLSGVSSDTSNTNSFTHSITLSQGTWYFRVKATDAIGNETSYSSNGTVLIDVTPPTAPGTPSTTTPTTDTTPAWTWTASTDSGAGLANPAYTIQWSQAADFLSGVSSSTNNTNSFTHSTPLAQGTWYLRVKAADAVGNETSYSSNGTVLIDTAVPTTPGTPSTATPTTDTTPAWAWTSSTDSGAGLANPAYTMQWSQTSDFSGGVTSDTVNTNAFTHSTPLAQGTWYFRVKATDAVGNESPFSANGTVLIDTTLPTTPGTPSTTTPTADTTPAWTWTASTDGGSGLANPAYTVEWSQAADFLSGVSSSTTNVNNFTNSTPLSAGTWYFRAKAADAAGNESAFSSNGTVVIDLSAPTTPGTPSTTTPTADTTPAWTWTASTDPSGLATPAYTMQWSQAADFLSGVSSSTSNTNSFTHSITLAAGTWYFRAKAADTLGNESGYSAAGSVVIDSTGPSIPGTPTTSTPTVDTTPAWTWSASSDPSGLANPAYTVEWSQAADFLSGVTGATVNIAAYTHSVALAEGTWYFRVKATDTLSNESAFSSNGSVVIDATDPTAPGTPSTASATTDPTPTWTWTASTDSGAGLANPAYTVQWSQDPGFGSGVSSATINTNEYTHSVNLAEATWYFHVKTTDLVGNETSYSSNGTITIASADVTAPTTPGAPNTTSPTADTTPTWTWSTSTDSESGLANPAYTIEWSQSATFTSGNSSATSNTNSFTHSTPLTTATWYVRIRAADLVGNNSSYSTSGSVTVDASSPSISSVVSSSTASTSTISWTTDESASTQIEYGTTTAYGILTTETDVSPGVTSHSQQISSLGSCTTYHYRVISRDGLGNAAVGVDNTLTTTGCPTPPPPPPAPVAAPGTTPPAAPPAAVPDQETTVVIEPETFVLRIRVVDAQNNPVSGAVVTLTPQIVSSGVLGVLTAITNDQGIATFPAVVDGNYRMIIEYGDVRQEQNLELAGRVQGETVQVELTEVTVAPTEGVNPLLLVAACLLSTLLLAGAVLISRRKEQPDSYLI
jgi:nitrogen fixation protein FixH